MNNQLYNDKHDCTGCAACYISCPKSAIKMVEDTEGFFYPRIDIDLCIKCDKCIRICNSTKNKPIKHESIKCYAYINCDEEIRMSSKSGGAFTEISNLFLNAGGIVYGCILDENNKAIHFRGTSCSDRDKMRGSKYVQSNIIGVYNDLKSDLNCHKNVLFCGTPCQVSAIKSFLGKEYNNLFTIDIVCHGVPSPKILNEYLGFFEKKYNGKIESVNFCDKKFGWENNDKMSMIIKKSNKKIQIVNNYYRYLYSLHYIVRPSCFKCEFTSLNRVGDLTIGDFWGVNNNFSYLNDNRGISSIIVNTNKGKEIIKQIISGKNKIIEVSQNDISQPALQECYLEPDERALFWDLYNKKGFEKVLKKYTRYGIKNKISYFYKAVMFTVFGRKK